MPKQRSQHVFVVRLWQETDANAPPQWRGVVNHVSFQQQLYFTSLADLMDFIHWQINRRSDEQDFSHIKETPGRCAAQDDKNES